MAKGNFDKFPFAIKQDSAAEQNLRISVNPRYFASKTDPFE